MGDVKGISPPLCRFCKVRHWGICASEKVQREPETPKRKRPKASEAHHEQATQ